MNPVSSTSLDLARGLLALEAARGKNVAGGSVQPGAGKMDDAVRVCEKLRAMLTSFAGAAGFRSLLGRALTLARAQEPLLAGVHVLEDGTLTGLETVSPEKSATPAKHGARTGVAGELIVAHLLDLLGIFIGEPLTHQLVRSAWPDVPAHALRLKTEDTP